MEIKAQILSDSSSVLSEMLHTALRAAELQLAEQAAASMRAKMLETKSGRIYEDGHQASAPGETPADWHHPLLESIGSELLPENGAVAFAGGDRAPYLVTDLEYGSSDGRVAARPLVTPTAEEFKPIAIATLSNAAKEALK